MNTRRPSELENIIDGYNNTMLDNSKPQNSFLSKESLNVYKLALIEKIQKKEALKQKIIKKIKEKSLKYNSKHRDSTSVGQLSQLEDDDQEEPVTNIVVPISDISDFEPSPLKARLIENKVRKIELKYGMNVPKIDERSIESSQNFKDGFSGSKNLKKLDSIEKGFKLEDVDKENINSFNITSGRQLNFSKRGQNIAKVQGKKSIFSGRRRSEANNSRLSKGSKKKRITIQDQIEKLKAQFDIQKQRGNKLNRFKKSRTLTSNFSVLTTTSEYKQAGIAQETPKSSSRITFKESLRKSQSIKKVKKTSSKKILSQRSLSSTSPRFFISKSISNTQSFVKVVEQKGAAVSQFKILEKNKKINQGKKELKNEIEVRSSIIKKLIGCLDDRSKISDLVDHLLRVREENSKLKQFAPLNGDGDKKKASSKFICIR